MKRTIGFCEFCDTFRAYDRNDTFSYNGKRALFDYLEDCGDSTGEELELDVIALCCDYAESDAETIAQDYSLDTEGMEEDEVIDAVREYLEENTTIIAELDNGNFLYCSAF